MIYPQNFEEKIGFDHIRQLLKKNCGSTLGQDYADNMHFCEQYETIRFELDADEEFVHILQEELRFPDIQLFDLRPALKRIRIEGAYLSEEELFDLQRSLNSLQKIVHFLRKEEKEDKPPVYPRLHSLAKEVGVFPDILDEINRLLNKFGKIQDHASPQLAQIRKSIAITTAGISRRLHILLKAAQDEGFVEKGVSPSVRDGRLVIPVSPAYKRKINGIVHDESASGKTVFVEPAELVEANNQIRELEAEEKREIIRILTAFTDKLRPLSEEIIASHVFLGRIDFIQAKARLAILFNAIKPNFSDRPCMKWQKAVHPLLFLSLKKNNKAIVPLNISLDEKKRILLISGPNAGGKSVCLKTVGLLQYMLQCGLMIPLCESSETGLFSHIFIDIGDEQSIENDLSTYSSHLMNMKYFLRNCHTSTLLLIDEFGSGTEPKIGGAIAEACLEVFDQKGSYGLITTHYDNLKHFADDHEGIANGAMLYDRHLMQALFQLEIGRPGSSFAVDIARKIGLPENVIEKATELVGSDYIDMDKYLQDIVRDKRYWENKRQQIKQLEKDLKDINERYEQDLADIKQERKAILSKAKADAQQLLSDTNAQIENTIRGIKESQAEKSRTQELRKNLTTFKDKILEDNSREEERLLRAKGRYRMPKSREEKLLRKLTQNNHTPAVPKKVVKPAESLKVGDKVQLKGQESIGEILEIKGGKALVAYNLIKTRVELNQLEKGKAKKETPTKHQGLGLRLTDNIHHISMHFKQDIDVRGMRGDEALQTVMYHIDDAIVVGSQQVRILHGTGTGALRQIIRDYLRKVKEVRSFHDEHVQLGGSGITVVEF